MPEGHVTHRLAADLTDGFGGREVRVSSPQGRFAASAALLDASMLGKAEACGKQLLIRFEAPIRDPIVQIHLGLVGRLQLRPLGAPVGQVRLRINDDVVAADLSGPQLCRLVTPAEQVGVMAALGADPLRCDADPQAAWLRIHASSMPVAALLMDQRVTAGVGNIYRAEVLFRHRIDPFCTGNRLKRHSWEAIWADLVYLMALGVRDARIDTVFPEHTPQAMGRPERIDAHGGEVYVYRRDGQPCLVCGSRVRTAVLEGRNLYWCGRCQRRH